MPPPQLPADAPVPDVLVPDLERLGIPGRVEPKATIPLVGLAVADLGAFELVVGDGAEGRAAEPRVGDLAVPLVGQVRLDRDVAAVAVADAVAVGLDLLEQAVALEPVDDE